MLKKTAPIFTFCFILAGLAGAQVTTNSQVLEQAAQGFKLRERSSYTKALALAKQKGWPLTITGRRGATGVLVGVDAFNFPKYYITNNNTIAAATTRTNQLWSGGASGLNLSGSSDNMTNKMGIWDGGRILSTHVELTGRITQKDNPTSTNSHATHVAGTLMAGGVNPSAKGMAHGIKGILAYDFTNDNSEMATEAAGGLLASNHSYSIIAGWSFNSSQNRWEFYGRPNENEDYKFGFYSAEAQTLDSIAYNAPNYLIIKSAGNNRDENGPAVGQPYFRYNASNQMADAGNRPEGISSNNGYGIISWDGNAKNILTIGAVPGLAGGYNRTEDVVMSSFSCWGPTDDGRIKPDLVADGINVLSSYSTSNTSYASLSGTSMAAPNVTGSLLLLQEYYSKLKSGEFLRSATLKGLAIHTANEAGSAPGPDYQFGWGLPNVEKAAAVITAAVPANNAATSEHLLYQNVLNAGTPSFSKTVTASGKGLLRATICWTDVKGTVETVNVLNNEARKLVNDLDIRITKGNKTYLPWTLNPAAPANAALPGDNIRDNVERIDVDSTVPGENYTITVTHKGTLTSGQQAYSLIVSGAGGSAYCASAATNNAGGRIDSVSFKNIRLLNPAGPTTYTNNTHLVADIEPSQTIPIFVKAGSSDATNASKVIKVFIDYNNNGGFEPGEEVAASSVITNGNFTADITTPGNLTVGNISLMRIVLQETANTGDVAACGTYSKGETQDYRVRVVPPSNDLSINEITTPTVADCADNTQYLTVKIVNNGSVAKSNIPVTAEIKNGSSTVTLNGTYTGTIAALGSVEYTLQTPFVTTAGGSYTITATANTSGDQNTGNNSLSSTITIGAKGAGPAAVATICDNNAILKVTNSSSSTNYFWYTSPTDNRPVASGSSTSTPTIPTNKTYYVGTEARTTIGPVNKMVYTNGGYNNFRGNFMRFNASVPLIIESVRLYIGNPGTVKVTVARLGTVDQTAGTYSYTILATTTLKVTATHPDPRPASLDANGNPVERQGNPAADTGAVYYLNLPVTETGDLLLIAECDNGGATIFRNNGISGTTYPMSLPGIMSLTGNSVDLINSNPNPPASAYYYFFYNIKIRTMGATCPGDRVEVVASTAPTPAVTQVGDSLVSSIASGNQWFLNDTPVSGVTAQKIKPTQSGVYKVVVTDASGCQKTSNSVNYLVTALPPEVVAQEIKLSVSPNPNKGLFNLSFEVKSKADLSIELVSANGQKVYNSAYPGFTGKFSKEISIPNVSAATYVLKIYHDKKTYVQKVVIVK